MNPELVELKNRLVTSKPSFRKLRLENAVYVDKTKYIHQMVRAGTEEAYFLSRPRRFGKSLLLDTVGELFKGEEELFRGLYIHDKWDWEQKFPVIRLDFSLLEDSCATSSLREALMQRLNYALITSAEDLGIELDPSKDPDVLLSDFIRELYKRSEGKGVVVLIDEYDTAINSNIMKPKKANIAKKVMNSFYKALKRSNSYIRFLMLTGITKFTGLGIFSALNNLSDISLHPDYSAICGYTEAEMDDYFGPFMEVVDRDRFREMYNGYNWLGESVYNPVDVMKGINWIVSTEDVNYFKPFWFKTGTPTFLINLMKKRGVLIPNLNENGMSTELFSEIDINDIEVEPLLFQTGYLTIGNRVINERTGEYLYTLKYPNEEVKMSYNRFLLKEVFNGRQNRLAFEKLNDELLGALEDGDCQKLFDEIHLFFASLSHRWFSKNKIASSEGFYCGILYAIFRANAAYIEVESQTNLGQIDLSVKVGNKRYVIEVKVRENAKGKKGLDQILNNGYAAKFRNNDELYLLGMEFGIAERNIVEIEYCVGLDGERIKITADEQAS